MILGKRDDAPACDLARRQGGASVREGGTPDTTPVGLSDVERR